MGNTSNLEDSPVGGLTWNVTRSHQTQTHWNTLEAVQGDIVYKFDLGDNIQSRTSIGGEYNQTSQDFLFVLPLSNADFDFKAPTYPEQEPGAVFEDFWRFFRFQSQANAFTGIYAQESLSFWDGRFAITGGVRYNYTHTSRFMRWQGADPASGGIDPVTAFYDPSNPQRNSPGGTSAVWTGRWGVVFKPFSEFTNLSFFAGFNESFRPASGADFAGNLFGPTRAESTEGGVKLDLFNGFSGTISYYSLNITGLKRKDPDNFGFDVQDQNNVGSGFDMSLIYANRGFSAIANYYNGDIVNQDGSLPPSAPQETFSVFAKYTFEEGSMQGFTFGGGGKFQGTSPSNRARAPDGTLVFQPSTWDFDIFASYTKGRYKFQVNVANLTDETLWGEMFSATNNFLVERRRVKFTVSYRW